jgi:hypothetical protein
MMARRLFFVLFIFLIALIFSATMVWLRKKANFCPKSGQTAQMDPAATLAQLNRQIDKLLGDYNLDQSCINLKNDWANFKREMTATQRSIPRGRSLSSRTKKLVASIAKNCDIKNIQLAPYLDTSICPACVVDCMLFIDEELLNQLPDEAQKFVIAHELQHIKYKDWLLGYRARKKLPGQNNDTQNPMNRLMRLQELRADCAALGLNHEIALGHKKFMSAIKNRYGNGRNITHPTITARLALHNQMGLTQIT